MFCCRALLPILVICFSGSNGQSAVQTDEDNTNNVHHRMTTGEVRSIFGVSSHSEVPAYDVVVPLQRSEDGRFYSEDLDLHARKKRNADDSSRWFYTVKAFGRSLHLNLTRRSDFLSPNLRVETRHEDGSITHSKVPDDVSYLTGDVTSHPGSRVALSNDNGLTGMIHLKDETLMLQPLPAHLNEHDGSLGQAVPHVIFKRSVESFSAQCQQRGVIQKRDVSNESGRRANDGSEGHKFLEMTLVGDRYYIEKHGDKASELLVAMAHLVNSIFHDQSIGAKKVTVVLVKMILLKSNLDYTKSSANGKKLGVFSSWAKQSNPEEGSQFHADVVNLITLGGVGGLATLGSTCKGKNFGTSVSNDIGLATALIVAHETAHTLGVGHDDQGGCADGKNVMSRVVPGGPEAAMWSPCSQRNIQAFLSSEDSACLDNVPTRKHVKEPKEFQLKKPGQLFDAEMQCKLLYNENYYHCPEMKSNCGSLYCTSAPGSCVSVNAPPLEGTKCGDRHWCVKGQCVDDGSPFIDGGWSRWSRGYTSCSLTCGGGIQWKTRTCTNPPPQNGGEPCEGSNTGLTRLCNTKPCPEGSKTFRDLQCAEWKPEAVSIYKKEEPCKLDCRSKGWTTSRGMAKDASRCYSDILKKDICLGGNCVSVGCDSVIGSGVMYDRCDVCNGDGTRCNLIQGSYTKDWRELGPNKADTMVTVPKGSRKIAVEEIAADKELTIGVQDMEGKHLLNVYANGGRVPAVGTTIMWAGRKSTRERIYIPGPTTEDIKLVFIYWDRSRKKNNKGVRYRYLEPKKSPTPSAAEWKLGPWKECSEKCAGGVQTRSVSCIRTDDKSFVNQRLCGVKPPTRQECNKQACPPEWFISGWRPCSRTCGKGVQLRQIVCRQKVCQDEHKTLPSSKCGKKPNDAVQQPCNEANCPPEWVPLKWSKCSTTCGEGVVTRDLTCKRLTSDGTFVPVPEQLCRNAVRPVRKEPCNEDVSCSESSSLPEGYKAKGCFESKKSSPLKMIHNFRGNIDWNNIQQTIDACADMAREQPKLRVFGLKFFGECWAGSDAKKTYETLEQAKNPEDCVVGVGKEGTLFIYEFDRA